MKNKKNIQILVITIVGIIAINWVSTLVYKRFDLTQDQRYTLSDAAKETIANINSPIIMDVFLKGDFPPEFRRLQTETKQLLEEFSAYSPKIKYQFLNGSDVLSIAQEDFDVAKRLYNQQKVLFNQKKITEEEWKAIVNNYNEKGRYNTTLKKSLKPAQVEVRENGKVSTELIYPWALAYFDNKTVTIPLLKNQLGNSSEERINNSIQNLEYAFANGFSKLTQPKRRKIAILKGNAEMEDRYLFDFIKTLKEHYYIGQFMMDSVVSNPQKTLQEIKGYDLLIVAQPQEAFNESETYILDQ
ncbi:MAG: Gldg family protein, partial [Flavobacteriaceae bacterium]|nr:Gldg family protein [Flavobacteriaceae bacterium]